MTTWRVICGDALASLSTLPDECVQTCVTSPPYFGLRDYGVPGLHPVVVEKAFQEWAARPRNWKTREPIR